MLRVCAVLIFARLLAAQTVPNLYIVELSTEPVAVHAVRNARRGERPSLRDVAAEQHRSRVRAEQTAARVAIRRAEGEVTGAVENALNALIVRIPDDKAARLESLPGVVRVYPARQLHMLLDHALPLHKVPEAWAQVGPANAGAGVKIAIIDTGVDIGHPGFQDGGFAAPAGFPRANRPSDLAFTNNKVIVARSYSDLFIDPDPDPSARDHVGHGTATAMAAAGVANPGPLATISGVAPRAYIGSYKVFGTPGVNDGASDAAIVRAIDDAVADGMDVINLSLGTDVTMRYDPEVTALNNAAALGVVVVAAAGNNGPDPATISSPAVAPSAIAVGASNNDRAFAAAAVVGGGDPIVAFPSTASAGHGPVSGKLVDIAAFDGTGLGCSAMPANALAGSIAFLQRGICTFERKLNNALAAGAVGALVYNNVPGPPIAMSVGSATLPAEMISNLDGLAVKPLLGDPVQTTLRFTLGPFYADPAGLTDFSAMGPSIDLSIKPDMVAVGANVYTAAETGDPRGVIYSASGYSIEQGTSFSSPMVAGAAAVLKAARPGLTAAQYRSLLVNAAAPASAAPGTPARVQQGGGGLLDVFAALNSTVTAEPVSLGFGAVARDVNASRNLTITNTGTLTDTFQLSISAQDGGPIPRLAKSAVQLDPGGSMSIAVTLAASGLTAGQYEGSIVIRSVNSGIAAHVPYWYGVPSNDARHITALYAAPDTASAGAHVGRALIFRVTDEAGLPVAGATPSAEVLQGDGMATVQSIDTAVPNAYALGVLLGSLRGPNIYRIRVGNLTKDLVLIGN